MPASPPHRYPIPHVDRRGRTHQRYRRRRWRAVLLAALIPILAIAIVLATQSTDTHGAQVLHFTLDSRLVNQTLTETVVVPAGQSGKPRPLLVFLHGKGEDEDSNLDDAMFAALARLGPRAPDVVFPNGDEDSYWHNRRSGAWATYLTQEVIPRALRLTHADPHRIAIGGLSMGGFGAYNLARLHPGRFCAVGGDSPALWRSGGETAEGAFDNSEDFEHNDVIAYAEASPHPYGNTPLWIDVGSEDPFREADTAFAQILRAKGQRVQFHVWPGGHEQGYWQAHWGSYLGFYAEALAHCR